MMTPDAGPPTTVIFEVDTARRVGAQLRYPGNGPHLAQIRAAVWTVTGNPPPAQPDPPTTSPTSTT